MGISTRKSPSGFINSDTEPNQERKRRKQISKTTNVNTPKKKFKENTPRSSERKRSKNSPPSARQNRNRMEDMSESSSRIVEDLPDANNMTENITEKITKSPTLSRTNSNASMPSLEPRENSSTETSSKQSNITSKSEDMLENLSCTEPMVISTTPDIKSKTTELKNNTNTSVTKEEDEHSDITTDEKPNNTSPIKNITFKNDTNTGLGNENNNTSPEKNSKNTQVEEKNTSILSTSKLIKTQLEKEQDDPNNTENIPPDLVCRYNESLMSHINRILKERKIPVSSPLFNLLKDLKINTKRFDEKEKP